MFTTYYKYIRIQCGIKWMVNLNKLVFFVEKLKLKINAL